MRRQDSGINGSSRRLHSGTDQRYREAVPDDYLGDVIGNVNSRRGRIEGTELRKGATAINSMIPLSEMFGYATDLRSRTQGRGNYSMEFDHYEQVPNSIAEKVIGKK